jgi:hypothetical protein
MPGIPIQKFFLHGYEAPEKIVRTGDESAARVNVPTCWVGKKVVILRVEDEHPRAYLPACIPISSWSFGRF